MGWRGRVDKNRLPTDGRNGWHIGFDQARSISQAWTLTCTPFIFEVHKQDFKGNLVLFSLYQYF